MDKEVIEVIEETIIELQANCRITLFDIYGSVDGFHTATFITEKEENAEYEKPARTSDYAKRGH